MCYWVKTTFLHLIFLGGLHSFKTNKSTCTCALFSWVNSVLQHTDRIFPLINWSKQRVCTLTHTHHTHTLTHRPPYQHNFTNQDSSLFLHLLFLSSLIFLFFPLSPFSLLHLSVTLFYFLPLFPIPYCTDEISIFRCVQR